MNKTRLAILANFLETQVSPDRFNMDDWATGDLNECGTAGCAAGWACMIPEFQEAGLTMDKDNNLYYPVYKDHEGFAALERFFGFHSGDSFSEAARQQVHEIFRPDRYYIPSLFNVITRIRETIDAN